MSLSDKRLITRDEASFEELCKRPTIFIVGHRLHRRSINLPISRQSKNKTGKTHGETYAPTRCRSISQTVSTRPVTSPSILKT